MSRMRCEECGCHTLVQREVRGRVFIECETCGAQVGNDEDLNAIDFEDWADKRKIEPAARALVHALNEIDGFATYSSCEGHPQEGLPPYVYFTTAPESARFLYSLECLLDMLAPALSCRWTVEEVAGNPGSRWLRPTLSAQNRRLDEQKVAAAKNDLATIATAIGKHSKLSWWYD